MQIKNYKLTRDSTILIVSRAESTKMLGIDPELVLLDYNRSTLNRNERRGWTIKK